MKKKIKEITEEQRKKTHSLAQEFKKFISRGSVIDMAVGVIMGSAFSAIVTAVVNILLTLCTRGIPGGISGLITVLPPLNATQMAPEGYQNTYTRAEFLELTENSSSTVLSSSYVLNGETYYYKSLPILNWGALLTALVDFILIAAFLFLIVKIVGYAKTKKEAFLAVEQEKYFQKHPEERPSPVVPGAPAPTEVDLLKDIKSELIKLNEGKEKK
jgi:large conductance mechanosensitive channel